VIDLLSMATSEPRTLRAKLLLDLSETFEGWSDPLAVGVRFDGAIYAAARRSAEPPRRQNAAGAEFWKSRLDDPTDYLVVRMHDGATSSGARSEGNDASRVAKGGYRRVARGIDDGMALNDLLDVTSTP